MCKPLDMEAMRARDAINSRFPNFAVRVTGISDDCKVFFARMPYTNHDTAILLAGNTAEEMAECMERGIVCELDRMLAALEAAKRDVLRLPPVAEREG